MPDLCHHRTSRCYALSAFVKPVCATMLLPMKGEQRHVVCPQVLHVLGHLFRDAPGWGDPLPVHSGGHAQHCAGQRGGHAHAAVHHPTGRLRHHQAIHPPLGHLVTPVCHPLSCLNTHCQDCVGIVQIQYYAPLHVPMQNQYNSSMTSIYCPIVSL